MNIVDILSRSLISEGIEHKYEYIITKCTLELFEFGIKKEVQSYGIVVERRDLCDGKIIRIERDSVKNISPQRHKVQALAKLLYDNLVSPINFVDVVGDYIDEYITDYDEIFKELSIS